MVLSLDKDMVDLLIYDLHENEGGRNFQTHECHMSEAWMQKAKKLLTGVLDQYTTRHFGFW